MIFLHVPLQVVLPRSLEVAQFAIMAVLSPMHGLKVPFQLGPSEAAVQALFIFAGVNQPNMDVEAFHCGSKKIAVLAFDPIWDIHFSPLYMNASNMAT